VSPGRTALSVVAVVAVGLAAAALWQITTFESEQVSGDAYVIYGLTGPAMVSGNVAVLRTAAGTVVVDTMTFAFHGRWIRARATELGGGPVQAVINTHYHQDHTHGNPGFAPATRVVATARTRAHLLARDGAYWEGEAAAFLPNETFTHGHDLEIGGKTIRSLYLGRGHTDGDLVVLFEDDRVLVTGDLVFNHHYPNIDLEAGGSLPAWDATLDKVLELDFDRVIPGHGPVTDREGVRQFQRFIRQLWQVSRDAAAAGLSLAQTIATAPLTADAGYATISIPFVIGLDRAFVLRRGWEEATGTVRADGR
jgi:cyclase